MSINQLKTTLLLRLTIGTGVAKSHKCILVHGQLVVKKALVRTKALLARTQINRKARFVIIKI